MPQSKPSQCVYEIVVRYGGKETARLYPSEGKAASALADIGGGSVVRVSRYFLDPTALTVPVAGVLTANPKPRVARPAVFPADLGALRDAAVVNQSAVQEWAKTVRNHLGKALRAPVQVDA